jgi:hypothetical protein
MGLYEILSYNEFSVFLERFQILEVALTSAPNTDLFPG